MPGLLDQYGIANFYDTASRLDFARTNLFRVIQLGNLAPDNLIYLESTIMPGKDINNVVVPFMGLSFNVPGNVSYPGSESWQVKFRMDSIYNLRNLLEISSLQIFDDATSSGNYQIPNASSANKIILALLDKQGGVVKFMTLFGSWLKTIGNVNVTVASKGEIVEQEATIAYQFWRDGNV